MTSEYAGRHWSLVFRGVMQPDGSLSIDRLDAEPFLLGPDVLSAGVGELLTEPLPEPEYEIGIWYLDLKWDPWWLGSDRYWSRGKVRVGFDVPERFPDGSMHRVADGGRP